MNTKCIAYYQYQLKKILICLNIIPAFMDEIGVSVAMAVYNGEKYVRDQIISILRQLRKDDELIISYDESSDNSLSILTEFARSDRRVKIYNNPYKSGVVKNFQNAVEHCSGDIIFLSDQDDVWLPNKVDRVLCEFEDSHVAVVIHDSKLTDSDLNIKFDSTFKLRGGVRTSFLGNIYRLSYIGCCMAFRGFYKELVVPFPTIYRSHDWWIGSLLSCGRTKIKAIDEALILHRDHANNVTPKSRPSLNYQFQVRWIIIKNVIARYLYKIRIDKSHNL